MCFKIFYYLLKWLKAKVESWTNNRDLENVVNEVSETGREILGTVEPNNIYVAVITIFYE